jgi:hypothetical protein
VLVIGRLSENEEVAHRLRLVTLGALVFVRIGIVRGTNAVRVGRAVVRHEPSERREVPALHRTGVVLKVEVAVDE